MVKDNRRIAPPNNCVPPSTFQSVKKFQTIIKGDGTRIDGRKFDDLRPITLKVGFIPSVTGSAYLECGNTKIIASINGPRDVLHKTDSLSKGQVYCEFKYTMFSCKERQSYISNDEEIAISKAIQDALEPVILLHKFPKARLDISIMVLENDGGAVSASITCAAAALSNAGVEVFDLPIGCSLVFTGEHVLIDPNIDEESYQRAGDYAKITIAMMPACNNQIIFMDSVGCLKPSLLSKSLKILQSKCQIILTHIKDCLKLHLKNSVDPSSDSDRDNEESHDLVKATELKLFQPQKYMSVHLEHNIRPDARELNEFRNIILSVGSIGTAYGSAFVRLKDTSVLCGIKAELTNPTLEEPNKGFLVPNVTMTSICSNKFQPGPPTEQAQVYSHIIMELLKNSYFLDMSSLCIAKEKLAWCLFIEMVCISHDGNILDACILALMAALKNTKLPQVQIADDEVEVTDKFMPLNLNYYTYPATFAILKGGVVTDPSAEEESLAEGMLTIFMKEDGSMSIQSFGVMKQEHLFSCIEIAKSRISVINQLLEISN